MAYCKYCGKELPPDGICLCPQGQTAAAVQAVSPMSGLQPDSAGITDNTDIQKAKKQRNWLLIFGVILVLLIVLIGFIVSSANAYKKPVNKFVKGLNKADTLMIIDAVLPESYLDELKNSIEISSKDWKKSVKEADNKLEDALEAQGIKKISVKFLDKEKLKDDELHSLEALYKLMGGSDVKKAYKVEADVTIKKKGDNQEKTGYFYVVKIDGDGWNMLPFDDTFGFTNMIDLDL